MRNIKYGIGFDSVIDPIDYKKEISNDIYRKNYDTVLIFVSEIKNDISTIIKDNIQYGKY